MTTYSSEELIRSNIIDDEACINSYTGGQAISLKCAVAQLEQKLIKESLEQNNYILTKVCDQLGLGRTTLWRKLKQYKIQAIDEQNTL